MNGNKYLLDTNVLLKYLQGDSHLKFLYKPETHLVFSIITVLEIQSSAALSAKDLHLVNEFFEQNECVNISMDDKLLIKNAVSIRKKYKLKLPDALIAASALNTSSVLVSGDAAFKNIFGLNFYLI